MCTRQISSTNIKCVSVDLLTSLPKILPCRRILLCVDECERPKSAKPNLAIHLYVFSRSFGFISCASTIAYCRSHAYAAFEKTDNGSSAAGLAVVATDAATLAVEAAGSSAFGDSTLFSGTFILLSDLAMAVPLTGVRKCKIQNAAARPKHKNDRDYCSSRRSAEMFSRTWPENKRFLVSIETTIYLPQYYVHSGPHIRVFDAPPLGKRIPDLLLKNDKYDPT